MGIAKRTVQLVVRTEAPAFPPPPPPTAALIPLPYDHHAVPRPSQQHLVSAMYGSTVFLHCPESTGSTRGTMWQLPSKTIMDQYRSVKPSSSWSNVALFWMNAFPRGVHGMYCCDCFTLPLSLFLCSPDRSITVFRNGTLRILHLTEIDGGNYLCLFQRPNGEDMEVFQVSRE